MKNQNNNQNQKNIQINVQSNILKHYMKDVYFITGTSYAGKSTMCKALARKYNMLHFEENYNSDTIFNVINSQSQPNLSYFHEKSGWEEYLNRTPEEYVKWIRGNSEELAGFEIAEILRCSGYGKIIVDTNLPIDVLHEISDYNHIVVMTSEPKVSAESFFDREDAEKQFLLNQINLCQNPEDTYKNFINCLSSLNKYEKNLYSDTGLFTIRRKHGEWMSEEETLAVIAEHFGLNEV